MDEQAKKLLRLIYGEEQAEKIWPQVEALINQFQDSSHTRPFAHYFNQHDAVLITYADMISRPGETPLQTLAGFLRKNLNGVASTIHLLPFFPSSSDDGFSVIDYYAVDKTLGTWADVRAIGRDFKLMFDAVVNHISAKSAWFQGYLQGDPRFRHFFVTADPAGDLSAVFRPRALPLLMEVQSAGGTKHLWTTFSNDQIDLNYANPEVLLEITRLLLFYIRQGADLIRLDAIGFLWKEIGTTCIHLPQTHYIIQFWRCIFNMVTPHVAIVTETNVPHQDNIAYFGDGTNEAQMVYNFSLPPLTLHAFHTGDATTLSTWAKTLSLPSKQVTFFNFLASHDGIGLTPARNLLTHDEISRIAERVQQLGGQVSYRQNPDGSQSAYELNINFLEALGNPEVKPESVEIITGRFLCAQAIMLALRGVPGIYFHSLFGSRGWPEGVQATGRARTINRQKLSVEHLAAELAAPGSLRNRVFSGFKELLELRAGSAAFHPHGEQEVLELHPAVFALKRSSVDGQNVVLCLHHVGKQVVEITLPPSEYTDMRTRSLVPGSARLIMQPHQVVWLERH